MKKNSLPIKLLLLLSVWLTGCSTLERGFEVMIKEKQ